MISLVPDVYVVFNGEGELSLKKKVRLLLRRLDLSLRVGQRRRHVGVPKPSVHLHHTKQKNAAGNEEIDIVSSGTL